MRELAAALAALMPEVGVGWADPCMTPPGHLPMGAIEARRREFAAGRAAAAQAMAMLGISADIPIGDDRAPVWPDGLSGSITHTRSIALAVLQRGGPIGIDLEPEGAVTPDLFSEILLPEERADPALATAIFCAKEATFKAQYPLTRLMFGFDRLAITITQTTFTARFTAETGPIPAGTIWPGHLIRARGHILALCRP
jgi:4'-phosphopantetheinyl transferase EntD